MTPENLNRALAEAAKVEHEVQYRGEVGFCRTCKRSDWIIRNIGGQCIPDFASSIDAQHRWIDPLVEAKWRGPFREQTWFYEGKWHWQLWEWPELFASGEAIEWAAARAEALLAALQ